MISLGIVWNSSYQFSGDIIDDILNSNIELIGYFDLELDRYIEFVNHIYKAETMEEWKIERKLKHMLMDDSSTIRIIFFEFDEKLTRFHPLKKKVVFSQLEDLKDKIRSKYKDQIPNYTFDIIFHATDDISEFRECYGIVLNYLNCLKCGFDEDTIASIGDRICKS